MNYTKARNITLVALVIVLVLTALALFGPRAKAQDVPPVISGTVDATALITRLRYEAGINYTYAEEFHNSEPTAFWYFLGRADGETNLANEIQQSLAP